MGKIIHLLFQATTETLTNDQEFDVDAYGNVIAPIKNNRFIKENVGNTYHIYMDKHGHMSKGAEKFVMGEDAAENFKNVIGLAGTASNIQGP